MSGDDSSNESSGIELSRRTFTKAAGAAAGAGLLGASANTAGASHSDLALSDLANPRVQELAKVWDRGYRGNADRAIGLTDSGLDARHPDLGPWNGVRAFEDGDELKLVDQNIRNVRKHDVSLSDVGLAEAFPASKQVPPGTFVEGSEVVIKRFTVGGVPNVEGTTLYVNAELDWSPTAQAEDGNDLEFRLDKNVGSVNKPNWKTVARTATGSVPERISAAKVEHAQEYRFVAEMYTNAVSTATVYLSGAESPNSNETANGDPSDDLGFYEVEVAKDGLLDEPAIDVGDAQDKTVGWVDPTARFGSLKEPRDPDGHGSHVSSIMGGSGRASAVKEVVEHGNESGSPEVLLAGMSKDIYVDAEAGEGIFCAAYGDNLEIQVVNPDGEVIAESAVGSDTSEYDNNVVTTPVEEGGTYIVEIRAGSPSASASAGGQSVRNQTLPEETIEIDPDDQFGGASPAVGRVKEYAAGSLESVANAGDGDRTEDGQVSIHSGVAPNASLVGLQGFGAPVGVLARHGDTFTREFNLRSVNMSWGYVGGLPLGGFGQDLDGGVVRNVKKMAEQGIMTVAAAGNAATPANGNGAPAVADEAISVVATGPRDGIVAYSSGGIGGNDEGDAEGTENGNNDDDSGQYMKPDVTAPGGSLTDLVQAAKANTSDFSDDEQPRDYTGKAGTSMASPFVNGVAGLVADAMEDGDKFDTGDDGLLPEPKDTSFDDVMRWKQVILATATQTAFTAAPYHRGKAPTYQPDGSRDPFEGYGRVNPDAAIDAVTENLYGGGRTLTDTSFAPGTTVDTTHEGTVGLDVPKDSRAVAGFVDAPRGTLDVSVTPGSYSGGNKGMTKGSPQIDLFVYDAENPAANGEPNVVGSARSTDGSTATASVDVSVGGTSYDVADPDRETKKLLVVAKLVNVPGVVNGYDVQVPLDFELGFTLEDLPAFTATGSRANETETYLGGSTVDMKVTLDDLTEVDGGRIVDNIPASWEPVAGFGDYVSDEATDDGRRLVDLGSVEAAEVDGDNESVTRNYRVEVQNEGGQATLGPAHVEVANPRDKGVRNGQDTFGGSNDNVVTTSPSSATTTTSETASDPTGSTTDTVTSGSDDGSLTETVTDTL